MRIRNVLCASVAAIATSATVVWQGTAEPVLAKSPQVPFRFMEATILETQAALAAGTITSEDLVRMYLARIAAFDKTGPALNAIIRLNPNALPEARALDAERRGVSGTLSTRTPRPAVSACRIAASCPYHRPMLWIAPQILVPARIALR